MHNLLKRSEALPQLGLAMALVRRGMDDVMRMTCELGLDHVQPIQADRSVPQAEHRPERWGVILQRLLSRAKGFGCLTCIPVFRADDGG